MHTQVLIIGSGPAGYTAAIYTARAGLNTTLFTGKTIGGQLTRTLEVENFPGFNMISGFDLMEKFKNQAQHIGVNIIQDEIINLNLSEKPFKFESSNNLSGTSDSVIMATGASPKWLNIEGEEIFKGKGISICATCDGFFYKNKTVAVIGGGNSALYEALFLSNVANNIYLINKNNLFTGDKKLQEKVFANPKITIINNTEVIEFKGEQKLTHLILKNKLDSKINEISVDGVFEAIGTQPNIDLISSQLKITKNGYIHTNKRTMETSIKGVFACGDVQEDKFKQAIISAGSGAIAALSAEKYLCNI